MTLTDAAALTGLVFGLVGTVLGVLNYLRDRTIVAVFLQWDMQYVQHGRPGLTGLVRVQNVGRRPVYVSHVVINTGHGESFLLRDAIQGQRLEEGSAPLVFPVDYEGLEPFAKNWWLLRAEVSDTTGKVWRSPRLSGNPPSWARTRGAEPV